MLIFLSSLLKLNALIHMTVRRFQIHMHHNSGGNIAVDEEKGLHGIERRVSFRDTSQKKMNDVVVSFNGQTGLNYTNFTRRILFSLRSQIYKYP